MDRKTKNSKASQEGESNKGPQWIWLLGVACASAWLYFEIGRLGQYFRYDAPILDRPIIAMLVLFAITFVLYLAACAVVLRASESRRLLAVIYGSAIAFRLILVGSVPIQEVDIYRYIWDGAVVAAGVNPFHYSPDQVLKANDTNVPIAPELAKLTHIRNRSESLATALDRVHYGYLPTIYPPTSQLVFGAVSATMSPDATLDARLTRMKLALCAFDLATLWLVAQLLLIAGKPTSWCLLYGWCPLLMKEVANSGHLDAIAVFFMTLAIYLASLAFRNGGSKTASHAAPRWLHIAAVALAAAFAAKLFPVILVPCFATLAWKRAGVKATMISALIFIAVAGIFMWPMMGRQVTTPDGGSVKSTDGLEKFLKTWEMNDFVFLVLIENIKPDWAVAPENRAWFTILPDTFRAQLVDFLSQRFNVPSDEVPFAVARTLTLLVFGLLTLFFCRAVWRNPSLEKWYESCFLTLAWFWLLCPTQNPWYWTWAMPLLVFARQRTWWLMSGICLVYYLRFWLIYHWPDSPVLAAGYSGASFFDLVVTWIEYVPWFILLTYESLMATKNSRD